MGTIRVPIRRSETSAEGAHTAAFFKTFARLAAFADRVAPVLVGIFVGGYFLLFDAMSLYWRDHLRWGFDILVYSQPIWNTAHGRLWQVSIYSFTTTELGHDLVLIELALAPLYRFIGSNLALVLVQSAAIALGGLGAYAVGRVAMPHMNRVVPALCALLYLSLLFVQRTNLDEFKSRNLVMWVWFFVWIGYRTRRSWLIWLMLGIALLTRSDVALVVVMCGVYGLLSPLRGSVAHPRRPWMQTILPIVIGAAWFVMVVYVIVPRHSTQGFIYDENYDWLGGSLTGIITHTVTRPLYVLQGVLTSAKLRYTFDLLFPFAFLSLLRPKILLLPLPIYLLNMLSAYENQFSIVHHYQALVVPFLAIAAIEAVAAIAKGFSVSAGDPAQSVEDDWLVRLAATIRRKLQLPSLVAALSPLVLVALMLACSGVQQLTVNSPVLSYAFHHGPSARAEAGKQLLREVPRDAPLAVTQKLAGMMPDRRYVYSFPGDPLYHDPALIAHADYLIGDEELSTFEADAIARYRVDPAWKVLDERGGFILIHREIPHADVGGAG